MTLKTLTTEFSTEGNFASAGAEAASDGAALDAMGFEGAAPEAAEAG
jgi:hypothetical protein